MQESTGKSKLARRFAWLFILCAFLPTLVLILVAYEKVSSQMLGQSVDKIVRNTKTYGLSLFDRLTRIGDQLMFVKRVLEVEGVGNERLVKTIPPETLELFDGVGFLEESGRFIELIGKIELPNGKAMKDFSAGKPGQVSIYTDKTLAGSVRVFVSCGIQSPKTGKGVIIGVINIPRLWGVGTVPLLPPATELAVYDQDGEILIGTFASPGNRFNEVVTFDSGKNLRNFEYSHDGERHMAGLWTLFLQSKFEAGSWQIVLSQSEEYLLASLEDFKRNLILVITLGLLIIMLLSMYFIRKGLAPLGELKKRTRQIAEKDFTSEVSVNSGDEFEELADSFNIMSRQLQKQFSALEAIDRIDRAILSSLKLPEVINTTLQMVRDFFSCDTIILGRVLASSDNHLKIYVLQTEMEAPAIEYVKHDYREQKDYFKTLKPVLLENGQNYPVYFDGLQLQAKETVLSVPLTKNDIITGVLILVHERLKKYDDEELAQVRQLADQVSIALSNSELVESLEKLATGTIEALARTVDAKSKWTAGHSERVSEFAGRIGLAMGYSYEQTDMLNRGGLLHDIGKIGIPLLILNKPGKLDDDEYKEVMNHPSIGVKILEPIEAYQDIIPMIHQHHERFDGKGYPQGLAGEEIDLNARILAVADVYDALTSQRPYRDGWVRDKAVEYIISNSGTFFDPEVVNAFRVALE